MARNIHLREKPDIETNGYTQLMLYIDRLLFDFEDILKELKGYPTGDFDISEYGPGPEVHRVSRTYEFQSGGAIDFIVEAERGSNGLIERQSLTYPLIHIDINMSGSYAVDDDGSKFLDKLTEYIEQHDMQICTDLSARDGKIKDNLLSSGVPLQNNEMWDEHVTLTWLSER